MTPVSSPLLHLAAVTAALLVVAADAVAGNILFIGNSFTYGQGSAVHYYRADTVTDLNGQGIGGMPALFKSFTVQAGLDFDVYLETQGGVGLDPRSLGDNECSGYELGLSRPQIAELEQVAFDQLAETGLAKPAASKRVNPGEPVRCRSPH